MKEIELLIPYGGGDQIPDSIVVHAMAEYILLEGRRIHASAFLFVTPWIIETELSAHILVTPKGDVLRSHPDNKIAWHAKGHNTNSLGIEFLVEGGYNYINFINRIRTPYLTAEQYTAGVEVVNYWQSLHEIQAVDRHSDLSPDRKVDPGDGFPWMDFKGRIGR